MSDASSPVESIDAVTLAVGDMATSHSFYSSLGFAAVSGGPTASFTTFRAGSGYLNLQLDPDHAPVPAIWGRVIFFVDDVDAMYQRAVTAGHSPSTEPADAPWNERYFHLRDPDGHELSFARPLTPPVPDASEVGPPTDVHDMMGAFRRAITSGDADRMAALYEDDAVYYLPSLGIAAKGRAAIRDRWVETFEAWTALDFEVVEQDLQVNDDLASSWLQASLTVRWKETGKQEVLPVKAADVFRRGADGCWRYAVDHA